ncbi:MAG TPA: hypothetical protein VHA82_17515 [Ramlibacter sp.]|uniref:hypothetical protein n=1 Tax=Ramlibacter sp. TaxID=1917967 RepID=UPI002B6EFA77|nr:hypothetical protein [Ramlibacter sp.]HVZ45613.1 hypothetical protein [Ramlibacter sp.]
MILGLLQKPGDRVHVQRFPSDIGAAQRVTVELGGVMTHLMNVEGLALRRPKSRREKRQRRFTLLDMEFLQRVIARELRVNLTTSEVFLIGRTYSPVILAEEILTPNKSTLTTYYKREGGKKKILHAYYYSAGHPFINIDRVLDTYDRVFCIDTNTGVNRRGQTIAVTTAIWGKGKRLGDVASHMQSDATLQVIDKDPAPGNAELHGIAKVFSHLNHNAPQFLEGRIAIITDTEYDRIKAWNQRTETFYNDHNLPVGVDIFYATSDSGSDEFMANKMMRACDTLSTQKLREELAK